MTYEQCVMCSWLDGKVYKLCKDCRQSETSHVAMLGDRQLPPPTELQKRRHESVLRWRAEKPDIRGPGPNSTYS